MHFALAKAYNDTAAPERGFEHSLQANAVRHRRINYDEKVALEKILIQFAIFFGATC